MSIELKTEYVAAKAISIIKRASALISIILVAMRVQCNAKEIGLRSLATWLSITSAEYTSLKELVAIVPGISLEIGATILGVAVVTTLLMIYLANVDPLPKNNTKMTALLVHSKRSTR